MADRTAGPAHGIAGVVVTTLLVTAVVVAGAVTWLDDGVTIDLGPVAAVAAAITVLIALPLRLKESDETASVGMADAAVLVGLVLLGAASLLTAATVGAALGWVLLRRRNRTSGAGSPPGLVLSQATASISTYVLGVAAALWTFSLLPTEGDAQLVLAAAVATVVAAVVNHVSLSVVIAFATERRFPAVVAELGLAHTAATSASVLVGSMVALVGLANGAMLAWMAATTTLLAAVALTQTLSDRGRRYLVGVLTAAERFHDSMEPDEVERDLVDVCGEYLRADRVELRDGEPRPGELGTVLGDGRWLVVGDRQGFGGRFTESDAQLLRGIAEIANVALRNAALHDQIAELAIRDDLTGLTTRRGLVEAFPQARAQAEREGGHLTLVFIDLDRFKAVNDTHGHDAGDRLLVEVADRLRSVSRDSDLVCRLGGDEFVILATDRDGATGFALRQRLAEAFEEPFANASDVEVGASLGVAVYPEDGVTLDELLRTSDAAMYQQKSRRKAAR